LEVAISFASAARLRIGFVRAIRDPGDLVFLPEFEAAQAGDGSGQFRAAKDFLSLRVRILSDVFPWVVVSGTDVMRNWREREEQGEPNETEGEPNEDEAIEERHTAIAHCSLSLSTDKNM